MLDGVDNASWLPEEQPGWNRPGEIPAALRALERAGNASRAREAYDRLLYAIGNNHAGTYYPVVLKVLPFLGELLSHNSTHVRETVLDILTDLTISFEPEPIAAGNVGDLRVAVQVAVRGLRETVAECASAVRASPRERELARNLLAAL